MVHDSLWQLLKFESLQRFGSVVFLGYPFWLVLKGSQKGTNHVCLCFGGGPKKTDPLVTCPTPCFTILQGIPGSDITMWNTTQGPGRCSLTQDPRIRGLISPLLHARDIWEYETREMLSQSTSKGPKVPRDAEVSLPCYLVPAIPLGFQASLWFNCRVHLTSKSWLFPDLCPPDLSTLLEPDL